MRARAARRIRSRCGSTPRTRPRLPPELRACSPQVALARGGARRDLGRDAAPRSRRSTTRCSPSSSSTAPTAPRRVAQLQAALAATELGGIETNLDYLRAARPARRASRGRDAHARRSATFDYTAAHHRGARRRHADHGAGLPGPPRLLGRRRAAVGADGRAVVPARATGSLGNAEGAAGLEITLPGPTLRFNADAAICLDRRGHDARRSTASRSPLLAAVRRRGRARR